MLNALQCFADLLLFGAEADAHVAAAVRAEDETRRDEHPCLMQHTFREFLGFGIAFRDASPERTDGKA